MSSQQKQRLELAWIGKENRPRLEPRVSLEDPERSHHASRKSLFDTQDEIDARRERFIADMERKWAQKATRAGVLSIHWRLS